MSGWVTDLLYLSTRAYSALPASSVSRGMVALITDCSTNGVGSTALGGGSITAIVWSKGSTSWLIMAST